MKKIIFILICFLFITGCDAKYEVEIYNDKINENINFYYDNSYSVNSAKITFDKYLDDFQDTSFLGDRKFEEVYDKKNDIYYIKETSKYNFNDYNDEINKIKLNFKTIDYRDNGELITFRTLGYTQYFEIYPELNNLKVVIKSNHKLKETNADEVKNNSYIWNIDRNNYKEIKPSVVLYSDKYVFNYNNEFVKKIIYISIFVGIIIVVGGTSYLYFKNKNNNANEI